EGTAPVGNIVIRAFRALYNARQEDKRSIGQLLGDAVKGSMNTILLIGGFIIVFSVFLRIISVMGLTVLLTSFFTWTLGAVGFSTNLASAMVSGLFEIDIGTMAASQADAPLAEKVAVAGAIIAWSGLCVHGQVASIVIESGIRITPYIFGRALHAVIAAVLTLLLMGPGESVSLALSVPVTVAVGGGGSPAFWLLRFEQVGYAVLLFTALLLAMSLVCHIGRELRLMVKK
ncbi:MAG TPA: sporulation integral membrane protein YlbJ, partial [Negativicutes bacterium]|nr:sporulation integral membrane protein YlbJ [Negativicutes bacterium]